MDETAALQFRRSLVQRLECLERAGVRELPRVIVSARCDEPAAEGLPALAQHEPPPAQPRTHLLGRSEDARATKTGEPSAAKEPTPTVKKDASLLVSAAWGGALKLPPEQRQWALDVISAEVSGCERCRELATTRTQTVFGVGNPSARLCFMGEAPGADEDKQGEPFVGRAGQLLNKIIEACTLKREDVFILNTIKCRPPDNRNPLPTEVANCREYLDRQLDIIQPEFICCLGLVAAQALLGTDLAIGKLRKRFFEHRGSRVLCTYHPAYLLRNPSAKKDVWEDMQFLMREMGIVLPGKRCGMKDER